MEMIDYLDQGAALGPDVPCFVQIGGASWTYREAVDLTHQIAAALSRDGFRPGDRLTVLSNNRADAFIALLGGMRAQLLWFPVNPRYSIESITKLLRQFSCDALFIDPSFGPELDTIRAAVPSIRKIVSLDGAVNGAVAMDAWICAAGSRHVPAPARPDDVAALLPTGGTTGASKGVLQTHLAFATYTALHMLVMPHDQPPKYLAATPLVHAAGGMCFPMLARGGTIYVLDGAKPHTVAQALTEFAITDLFLPPTVIYMMIADPQIRAMNFPALKYLLYGSAPMSVSKLREVLEWLGPVLVQGFGQTEAIMLCTAMRPADHYVAGDVGGEIASDERLSSCGRPVPFVKMAVMDENGELLGEDQKGELVVRANHVMKGYYNDPEATAAASAHGWHHTGDIGYRDAEGFYHIVDRLRDMIISGGLNIFPSEIEQVIWSYPDVADCAVVGVADEKWGELVTAVVEAKPGAQLDPDALVEFCRSRLGSLKAPKQVLVWDELPRSPVGKVLKRAIRDALHARESET